MSSTLARPAGPIADAEPIPASRPTAVATAAPAPVEAPVEGLTAAPGAATQDETDFRGFVKAILVGCGIGTLVLMALMVGVMKVFSPDTELIADFGIAVWVSLWCGLFLGGTVTVGLWAHHNH